MSFLRPERQADLLEHGLVLLWELVQHQWTLFEDREAMLVDALFTLRATRNSTVGVTSHANTFEYATHSADSRVDQLPCLTLD